MASVTLPAHVDMTPPRRINVRTRLRAAARRVGAVVSAVRLNASPALTASGLISIDAAMFLHGWFAGLITVGISFFLYDWSHEKT